MKKHNIPTLVLLFFLTSFASLLVAPPVLAAGNILVTPSKVNLSAAPGEKIKKSIVIVNNTSEPVSLKVSVKDFTVADKFGKIKFIEKTGIESATKWLIPQYEVLNIAPAKSVDMEYIVAVDREMAGGGYGGAFSFQEYSKETQEPVGPEFGNIITLNVLRSGITTGGSVDEIKTPILQYQDPAKFSFSIQNNSNSNLARSGNIVFTNIFGKKIGQFETGELDLYPSSTRQFEFAWTDAPLFGIYKGQVMLTNTMRNDDKLEFPMWFGFLPWQKAIPALFGLLSLLVLAVIMLNIFLKQRIFGTKHLTT